MKTNSLFVALISITLSTIIYASILKTREKNIPQTLPEAPQSIIISDSINVRVTCYRATVEECGNDLGICYDGTKVCKGTVALSPDIFYYNRIIMGDTVLILGTPLDGWYVVHDKTADNIRNTVDIYISKETKGFSERGLLICEY
jgi:3D (Asp-Asp-Asp) domain-containing protein